MNTYYKIFKISLVNQLEYRVNFISEFLFSLLPFTVNVLLWIAVTHQSNTMPLEADGIVSYYFLTLITYNITSTVSVFKFLKNLPFAFISHIPVSLLLDDVPIRTAFIFLCKGCGWIALLAIFCAVVWKRGMRIYSAYGG